MFDKIRAALNSDKTIDIVTTGARTGVPRTTEIWFTRVGRRIIICGTSGFRRDWLANLKANPEFVFVLKESLSARLQARAVPIVDPEDRRKLMTSPETSWYREQGISVEDLVQGCPIVEVFFKEFTYAE